MIWITYGKNYSSKLEFHSNFMFSRSVKSWTIKIKEKKIFFASRYQDMENVQTIISHGGNTFGTDLDRSRTIGSEHEL